MTKLLWVNIYNVTQHYAGPEERGWFYDVGIPERSSQGLCSCPAHGDHWGVCPIHHLLIEAEAWIEGFKPGYLEGFISRDAEEPEYRGEAIHGRKEIREEDSPAHAYPDEQPFYE